MTEYETYICTCTDCKKDMDVDYLRGGLDEIDYDEINPFTPDDLLCDECIEKRFKNEEWENN